MHVIGLCSRLVRNLLIRHTATETEPVSKLMVRGADGTKHPFLRGIVTRSLQSAGLSFDEAYGLATRIREALDGTGLVTSKELREVVSEHLRSDYGQQIVDVYQMVLERRGHVRFRRRDGELDWFSRRLHQKRLERCGLTIDTASELAQMVYQDFLSGKKYEVDSEQIDAVTVNLLDKELGTDVSGRYQRWNEFDRGDGILFLLFGGAPGVGKSTLAGEVATRLDIVRTQSTDMLREIMREMVPAALVPELHGSSFEVQKTGDGRGANIKEDPNLYQSFRRQAELVQLASRAVLARAQRESVSVLVEGVHIWPGLLKNHVNLGSEDIMVELILTVTDQKQLVRRFRQRGKESPGRRGKRYLDHIGSIWAQQEILIEEAENHSISVVQNQDKEAATVEIMGLISHAIVANGSPL